MSSNSIFINCINGHYAKVSFLSSEKSEKSNLIIPKIGIWTSKWRVKLPNGFTKIYNITLFNEKKSDQKYLDEIPLATYIQVDDLSIPKIRNFQLIDKDGIIYSIDPNDFTNLGINLDFGKITKSKCQIYERMFVICNFLLDFFY